MANLSARTRQVLGFALGSKVIAAEVADAIDAHIAGTLSARNVRKIRSMFGSKVDADDFVTSVNGPTTLTGRQEQTLANALGNKQAAADIAARIAGL